MRKVKYQKQEIKKGITIHNLDTEKFKTNLIAIFLTTPLSREYVTFDAVLSAVLRRGSKNMPTQEEISKTLEGMYGADFDCGLNKTGDNHIIKFYLESVNDEFLPHNSENLLKESMEKISEIVFNPYLEEGKFKEEYVNQEKENIKQRINAKKDNKAAYAKTRCVEEMYKDEPAGLFRYGYVEDLENINSKNLYEYYQKLLSECKIDIFISGKINNEKCIQIISENENIKNLQPREAKYIINDIITKQNVQERTIEEKLDVTQGKIVIGCDILFDENDLKDENLRCQAMLYNSLLGGSANSKLFQNVREKASLAYTVSSNYVRYKSNIFINAGIEIDNFEQAVNIIRQQIEDMKNGDFTEEQIENEKKVIISQINTIDDEQDTEIIYFLGQELTNLNEGIEEYKENIRKVTKEQIQNVASKVKINTIFFLRNEEVENADNL